MKKMTSIPWHRTSNISAGNEKLQFFLLFSIEMQMNGFEFMTEFSTERNKLQFEQKIFFYMIQQ